MSKRNDFRKTAVALRYPEGFPAPFIACKGRGRLADAIIRTAKESGVPLVAEPETAQILSLQEIGSYIPQETYQILAAVFCFLKENEAYGND
ncbi:EscU/YscU/HrcU family type III secretion system export apparatus switch protein [Treponema sp. OMZ 840]|uniref:EscU/YscU/HrcU family type III secretion system export apparatus switch protein n=1 Tax=Treponema sp. OMZ 840 TaxID=244313 RepID=UPI003D89CBFF